MDLTDDHAARLRDGMASFAFDVYVQRLACDAASNAYARLRKALDDLDDGTGVKHEAKADDAQKA